MKKRTMLAASLALTCALALPAGAAFADEPAAPAVKTDAYGNVITGPKPQPGWPRLAGDIALDTMSSIVSSDAGWSVEGGTVVIASAEGWWDALSVSALAGSESAPVLLSYRDSVPQQTRDQLKRLKPARVVIMGGEAAVSEKTAAELAAVAGSNLKRYAGADAVGTAEAVAEAVGNKSEYAVVATAGTFHDALSAAPFAYAKRAPVFFTQPDGSLSSTTLSAIGNRKVIVMGGTAAVPASVEKQLGSRFLQRVGGADAVATSKLFAQKRLDEGASREGMGVATANGWYDALTGAALCGKQDSVLLLATDHDTSAITEVARKGWNTPSWKQCSGWIFGGMAALSDEAMMAIPASGYTD
ncbi:MAG: cell wall-binding repeat-containing protein [Berryella intestinalis]|uniref:cell wall-binding repeat-containing protein n=1 Tax=Berryella intestinalis TaxID=1531429 RepID=UPI002A52CA4B|nr:cell wall-binding repeat-containing protein [Berryella intestinalis]MDD7369498.1 cell wall-binding repeat-containing protein [Berryella intestinalis]MDY3129504.1 cell wall-binding repeat-containing protein [Berryella intestinalis]